LLGALSALSLTAGACEKTTWEVSLGARQLDSQLTEYSSGGKLLVTEHGSFVGTETKAAISCDRWTADLGFVSSAGDRDYVGQTTVGTALTTKSGIEDRVVAASLYWRYLESIQIGLDLSEQDTTRTIVGTRVAAGYPESYSRRTTRMGAKWDLASSFGRWTLGGAVSVQAKQSMDLKLPGKDPSVLRFNDPKQWELSAQWRKDLGKHLFIDGAYRYINTEIDQSDFAVVTASGNPVGVVYQPKMKLVDQAFSVAIGVLF